MILGSAKLREKSKDYMNINFAAEHPHGMQTARWDDLFTLPTTHPVPNVLVLSKNDRLDGRSKERCDAESGDGGTECNFRDRSCELLRGEICVHTRKLGPGVLR